MKYIIYLLREIATEYQVSLSRAPIKENKWINIFHSINNCVLVTDEQLDFHLMSSGFVPCLVAKGLEINEKNIAM